MIPEPDVSSAPTQRTTQPRPASSACLIAQERGFRCLPVVPGTSWCAKHHPERQAANRESARLAARASHARRPDPELEAWADTLDWRTEEKREQALREVAVLVAKGGLTPAQGQAIAALARAAVTRPWKAAKPAAPLLVEVQRFGANGTEPTEPGS